MIAHENYLNNIDVKEDNKLKIGYISKAVICGNIKLIKNKYIHVKKKPSDGKTDFIPPLAATIVGLKNTIASSMPKPNVRNHTWVDIDTQSYFLDSKPTCYLILSKPGAGAFSLGETMSKELKCFHICPENVILDEIKQNSQTGKCLDFNMRQNKVIKIDTLMPIMRTKLQSLAVKHRGYVMSGIPLVTSNKEPLCYMGSLYSEESLLVVDPILLDLIYNLKKKKAKAAPPSSVSESSFHAGEEQPPEEEHEEEHIPEEGEEEEDKPIEMPNFLLDSCSNIIYNRKPYFDTKQAVLVRQLSELFQLDMPPDIIIYITCPDADLVTKKFHKYLDYETKANNITEPFVSNSELETRWPLKYALGDYNAKKDNTIFKNKYICRQPVNHSDQSVEQICNYKKEVLPFIENKLNDFNPRHIIKLDGRISTQQMMYSIMKTLHMIPIVHPVIIPEPLLLEEPPDDIEEFWKNIEDTATFHYGDLKFNRYPSPWFNRCPVELKKRRSVRGKPKYAVQFLKHVYLLSSVDNLILFCKNPRPYLNLNYLEPTCRIVVMGTKSSGKTMVSECLSWIFDAPIIDYKIILQMERIKKKNALDKNVLSEISAKIEDDRYTKWKNKEADRIMSLDEWHASSLNDLQKYIPLFQRFLKFQEIQQEKELIEGHEEEEISEENQKLIKTVESLKSKLKLLPFVDDLEKCQEALDNKDLLQYAPGALLKVTDPPAIPVLGDPDVTIAIANYIQTNELEKEAEPTPEEIVAAIAQMISSADNISSQTLTSYGKFIIDDFPSGIEYWDLLAETKLLPDNTIALIENREIDSNLADYYTFLKNCKKNHEGRFVLANDPLIKLKLLKKTSHGRTASQAVNTLPTIHNQEVDPEFVQLFTEGIEAFRENWDSIKIKLDENFKSFIEVELEGKTDINVIEDVLLKLRKSYYIPSEPKDDEGDVVQDNEEDEEAVPKDLLVYNDPYFLCETGIYCPIAFYNHRVLWKGKPEFSLKYNNRIHYFTSEENLEKFRQDITKFQAYNHPSKKLPPIRICVIGCLGSGRTAISNFIAKELGLLHLNFEKVVNYYLMPRHFKDVGIKSENKFTDIPFDEEAVVDFQMNEENENLITDIMSNETEFRRMVYNYFERGEPILSALLQKLIKKLWFEEPFLTTGFVLDGFPRLPSDIEDMLTCYCIPDLVLELESSSEAMLERISTFHFNTWKSQQNAEKLKAKQKMDKTRKEWVNFIKKKVVIKILIDEILDNVTAENSPVEELKVNHSAIIDAHPSGSLNVDENLFNTYNELVQEYPEPVDENVWEKNDEAKERIDTRLESIYESEDENIQNMKELLASRVPVPDERFDYLCEYHKPASKVPAFLNVVDIAGLVRGAAEGQGLGNAFLSHIKACDAIFNLCRAFDDEDVIHVDGEVNPVRDLETIGEELRLKDEEQLMQNFEKLDRVVNRGSDKKLKPEYDALTRIKAILVDEKKHIRFGDWGAADIEVLNKYLFLTSKPALYLVNLSEKDYIRKKNKWLPKLKEWIDKNDPGAPLIPFSGALESKLMDMDPEEKKAFLKENGITSALDKIIVQGYKALQLEYFFTAGPDEVKAWTIQKGTKAPQAAGRIHTDFEKGFIMAEVMHFKDFKEEGTEAACKAAGKYRQQGRNYVVDDGDIIFFKFNAGAGLKDAKKK